MNLFRNETGFTLIELLVVIAVLGVLASLVIPRLEGVNERGHDSNISAVAGTIKNAMESYYIDNGNQFPDVTTMTNNTGFQAWNELFGTNGIIEYIDLEVVDMNDLIDSYNIQAFQYSNPAGLQTYRMEFTSAYSSRVYILDESSFN